MIYDDINDFFHLPPNCIDAPKLLRTKPPWNCTHDVEQCIHWIPRKIRIINRKHLLNDESQFCHHRSYHFWLIVFPLPFVGVFILMKFDTIEFIWIDACSWSEQRKFTMYRPNRHNRIHEYKALPKNWTKKFKQNDIQLWEMNFVINRILNFGQILFAKQFHCNKLKSCLQFIDRPHT